MREGHQSHLASGSDVLGQGSSFCRAACNCVWHAGRECSFLPPEVLPLCLHPGHHYSLPVSCCSLIAIPLCLLAPWCSEVPESLSSHGVHCPCRMVLKTPRFSPTSFLQTLACWASMWSRLCKSSSSFGRCGCPQYGSFIMEGKALSVPTIRVAELLALQLWEWGKSVGPWVCLWEGRRSMSGLN